jgi:rubrerythrin
MDTTKEFTRLIEFAIGEEQKAQKLYRDMALKARDSYGRAILEGLYEQELAHEEKLRALLSSVKGTTAA